MTGECQKRVVLQMGSSSCFLLLLHPPLPFLTSAADASAAPGHEHLCTELQAQMHSMHTSVFVSVSASTCTASRCAFSLSPSPHWGFAPAETFVELPPSSCMGRSYCSISQFSLPLCLYDIRLWSLITCADAWYPDGPANRARSSKSALLWPVSLFLAMALTLTSPRHSSLGGQRGTGIPADAGDAPGTKESVGSSWPCQLLCWRMAPLASG